MALVFEATNSERAEVSAAPNYTGAWTMTAWVFLDESGSGKQWIMGVFAGNEQSWDAVAYDHTSSKLRAEASTAGSTAGANEGGTTATGEWVHVGVRRTGAVAFAEVIKNGVDVAGAFSSAATRSTADMRSLFAANLNGATSAYSAHLDGRVHAMKFWNGVALSDDEILFESLQNMPLHRNGIYSWYPTHSGSNRLHDQAGNERDMTANGTLSDDAGPGIRFGSEFNEDIVVPDPAAGDFAPFAAHVRRQSLQRIKRM